MTVVCVVGLVSACGGGGENGSGDGGSAGGPGTVNTVLSGMVHDAGAQPVANALVQVGSQTATTGADGKFSFTLADSNATTVVLVKKSGFATNAKEVPVVSGKATRVTVPLFADQVRTSFSATAGVTVAPNGARVAIPANAVRTVAGLAYSGNVNLAANYYGPDTVAGVQAFAAPYEGVEAGVRAALITMGVIEVQLTDASGNPLQLATGATATLTYPANSVSAGAASVPLWYYDETAKVWMAEGSAALQADGSYQASVAHFTMWNADFKGLSATLKGCFVDANGAAQTQPGLYGLRGNGWQRTASWEGGDGTFTVLQVPANMALELYSAVQPATFTTVAIPALAVGEVRQLDCIKATVSTSTAWDVYFPDFVFVPPVTTPGTPATPSTPGTPAIPGTPSTPSTPSTPTVPVAAFAGNYTGRYSGLEVGTFTVSIANNGVVSGSTYSTTYNLTSVVFGTVSASGAVNLTATAGSAGTAVFTGTISASGAVGGTWQYTNGSGVGNNTFAGQRS